VKPDYVIVNDVVTGANLTKKLVEQRWHYPSATLATDATARQATLTFPIFYGQNGNLLMKWAAPVAFEERDGWLGGEYAVNRDTSGKSPAKYLVATQKVDSPANFPTVLMPFTGATAPAVTVTSERSQKNVAIRVVRDTREDLAIFNDSSSSDLAGTSFNGKVALAQSSGGQLYRVVLHGGTRFRIGTTEITRATDFGNVTITWAYGLTLVEPPTPDLTIVGP
jgi:hypothetical protein